MVFQISLFPAADLHGILAPEESLNWKKQFPFSQKHSLEALQDPSETISKFYKWKAYLTSKTQLLILINTEVQLICTLTFGLSALVSA